MLQAESFMAIGWYVIQALSALLALVVSLYIYLRPNYVDSRVPGPKRHFLLGVTFDDASEFLDGQSFDWANWPTLSLRWSRKFRFQTWGGPMMNIGFGGAFFNVVSPTCLSHILRENFDNYEKGKLTKSFHELMGKVAFTTDGDEWKFHRKIAVSILNRETVLQGSKLILKKLKQIDKILQAKENQVVDFQDLSYRIILDVFVKLGFGVELNGIESDRHAPFVEAFNELQLLTHERFNDFFWEIKQRFGIGKRERRIKELAHVINRFADEIIETTKEAESSGSDVNIVTRYLNYCQEQQQPVPTNAELRNTVLGFVLGGRDTTSAALTWTMYEVTRNPSVKKKLRAELEVIVKEPLDGIWSRIQNLPYLHAVILESLRMHPPVPDSFRFARKKDVLPDGTFIPAGALVQFSTYAINHCEDIWEDPDVFSPDRFQRVKEPQPPANYPVFNIGPRTCPGKNLALMELKMCLAYLVPRYDFEDVSNHNGDFLWTLVMSMKGGFPARVIRHTDP